MIRAWFAALLIFVAFDRGAAAQPGGDKARLDDFAMPSTARDSAVQQITPRRELPPEDRQIHDRELAVPAPPAPARRALPQVGAAEGARPLTQLAPPGRTAAPSPALSQRADSAPGSTVKLIGADRCDPQSPDARDLARCRRIIELRAAEFSAAEAPMLSAEQSLLIEQQARERKLSVSRDSSARMARIAEDPNERTNQELAAVVLGSPAGDSLPRPDADPTSEASALAEVLQAIANGSALPSP